MNHRNYRTRIVPRRMNGTDGHDVIVVAPDGRTVLNSWGSGPIALARQDARDAIAADQAARRSVAA